jgi:hypothetical protein
MRIFTMLEAGWVGGRRRRPEPAPALLTDRAGRPPSDPLFPSFNSTPSFPKAESRLAFEPRSSLAQGFQGGEDALRSYFAESHFGAPFRGKGGASLSLGGAGSPLFPTPSVSNTRLSASRTFVPAMSVNAWAVAEPAQTRLQKYCCSRNYATQF